MHTIFDTSDRQQLLGRLRRLTSERAPRWGRMTAGQMLAHLGDQMRLTLGEQACAPMPGPYRNRLVRHVVIYWLPWPQAKVQAPPEAFTTAPTTWASDLAALEDQVERLATRGPAGIWPDHPMFGHMSGRDWGVFCYRHFDHHLRQFDA
jgi:Protein of unknown function (DUF1569)